MPIAAWMPQSIGDRVASHRLFHILTAFGNILCSAFRTPTYPILSHLIPTRFSA